MDAGITRQEALELMQSYLRADNLRKHCLATEAIMRALAEKLGFDPEAWGIAGLLHDLDYEETKDNPPQHGLKTEAILKEKGVSQEIIDAIKAHNAEALGIEPDKKSASVKPKSILKRMKQKEFARNVNRDHIRRCEMLNIPLEEFAELSLKAMGTISDELGL
jgi:putative nucleotidyltransferase with HDIG domain